VLVLDDKDKPGLGTYLQSDYCEVYDRLMKSTTMFLTAEKVKVTVL
jgi:hypothetical protein